MDCPVSGSKDQARRGELTTYVGAFERKIAELDQFLAAIAKNRFYFGEVGKGLQVKLINQMMHLTNMAAIREGMKLARAQQLDATNVVEALLVSSSSSKMLERFGLAIAAEDYTPNFTLELANKDLDLVVEEQKRLGLDLQLLTSTKSVFEKTLEGPYSKLNFSVICKEN